MANPENRKWMIHHFMEFRKKMMLWVQGAEQDCYCQ